jgi:predicted membrane protein (TIGR00267 family)
LTIFDLVPAAWAFPASILLILVILFVLGAFLGSISRENIVVAGLRMLTVGVATAVVFVLLAGLSPR